MLFLKESTSILECHNNVSRHAHYKIINGISAKEGQMRDESTNN